MSKFIQRKSDLQIEDGTIKTSIRVPSDSVWFDGHFPDTALLPGVAQLAMVVATLSAAFEKPVCVADVSRVRFKLAIKPDEQIDVEATPRENNTPSWGFRLLKGSEVACSGFLNLAPE